FWLEHPSVPRQVNFEIARVAERGQEAIRLRRGPLHHDTDRYALEVERDAKTEDEEQQERQNPGDQEAARVAQDLERFLADQPVQATRPAPGFRGCAAAPNIRVRSAGRIGRDSPHELPPRSNSSTSSMKASSRVGSGRAAARTRSLSASG